MEHTELSEEKKIIIEGLALEYQKVKKEIDELTDKLNQIKQKMIEETEEHPYYTDWFMLIKTEGRKTVQWKKVAEALNPPKELVEKFTKEGGVIWSVKFQN